MGWSATAKACDTERAWSDACVANGGSQNSYEADGVRYFYETGREQADGAIVGQTFRFTVTDHCVRAGTFRIEPDGTVTRYPTRFQRSAAGQALRKASA